VDPGLNSRVSPSLGPRTIVNFSIGGSIVERNDSDAWNVVLKWSRNRIQSVEINLKMEKDLVLSLNYLVCRYIKIFER
jgi:hypothetical protein